MDDPQSQEETKLIALSRNGDVAAFSRLIQKHQGRLVAQALSFCGDPDQARDLAQETMVAAWKSLSRFDGSCRFFTWLYAILLRQHRMGLGWYSRRLPLATMEQQAAARRHENAAPETMAESEEEAALIRAMLTALPRKHREVIRLRFYVEASEAEIAAALGISAGTVKSRLHHALEKLRQMKEKVNLLRNARH